MSGTFRIQPRRVLVSLVAMAFAWAPVAGSAQPTTPVQSAVAETITCPALPAVLLDYMIKGNLNLPQGWTPITKTPGGEPGGNTTVTLVPASVKVRDKDLLCGYATCAGSVKDCPPLLMVALPKPSGKQCEETSGNRFRCGLKVKAAPPPR